MEPTNSKLYSALAKAQGEIKNAYKGKDNPFFHSRYADLQMISDLVKPVFATHGIAVIMLPIGDKTSVGIRYCMTHESGEATPWAEITTSTCFIKEKGVVTDKIDNQATGSALTYFRRYILSAVGGVATTDDDGNASCDRGVEEKEEKRPQQSAAPKSVIEEVAMNPDLVNVPKEYILTLVKSAAKCDASVSSYDELSDNVKTWVNLPKTAERILARFNKAK